MNKYRIKLSLKVTFTSFEFDIFFFFFFFKPRSFLAKQKLINHLNE